MGNSGLRSRKAYRVVVLVLAVSVLAGYPQFMRSQTAAPASAQKAFLSQYCEGCHNDKVKAGGLLLDTMDVAHVGVNAETWEKVVRKLRAGMMPPSGAKHPVRPTTEGFVAWLENELDRSAAARPDFGSPG